MRALRLGDIARMTGGRLVGADVGITSLLTDTRALPAATIDVDADADRMRDPTMVGPLFVALKGERFDGHDHVAAAAPYVSAALVSRMIDARIPHVIVADTERSLADIARGMQATRRTRVFAITGSSGKTSVKALLSTILEQAGGAYVTPGNHNNQIGLPLTVIAAPDDARFAIYEMGAGQRGDIAYLTSIARPDIALSNNIAPAHMERMGSLLAIADTKAAIYDALPADGIAVINADDAFAPYFSERAHGRTLIRFGLESTSDVTARDIRADGDASTFVLVTPQGEADIALALPGRHNVRNALAAASMALGAGITLEAIAAGLGQARAVDGRLLTHRLRNGAVLVDDSYNANPGSLAAAIETLAAAGGERWLVLGDMLELGDDSRAMHADGGRRARDAGITRLYAMGELSAAAVDAFGTQARLFDSHVAVANALRADLAVLVEGTPVRVLVKGSRGSAMDRVVQALLDLEATR